MKIKKVVIPAAGIGSRFLPATKAVPKEIFPLLNKPIIQYIVEEAVQSGIRDLLFISGKNKEALTSHFKRSPHIERTLHIQGKKEILEEIMAIPQLAKIKSIVQKSPLGLGHAVLLCKEEVGNNPFAVILPDDLIDAQIPCLRQMIEIWERYHAPVVAVQRVKSEDTRYYGIVDGVQVEEKLFKIDRMVEKPEPSRAPSNLAIVGRYILYPEIFDILGKTSPGVGQEIQLTDALAELCKKSPVYAYEFDGARYDTGDCIGFLKASIAYALNNSYISPIIKEFLLELHFSEDGEKR